MNSAHHPCVEKLNSMISRVRRAQMTPTAISANPHVVFKVLFIRLIISSEGKNIKYLLLFYLFWGMVFIFAGNQ